MAAAASKTVVKSSGAVDTRVVHSYLVEEAVAFCEHINHCLSSDAFLSGNGYVPLAGPDALWPAISDGVLLSKLINLATPDTIDERALNFPPAGKKLNPWETKENQNIVINSARSIGCQVVNIHASDLIKCAEEHKEHLVLGLIWQIVKVQLLSQISIKEVPQLFRLLKEGEELPALLKLPPEEVLIRWVNYHMAKSGSGRAVNNLHADMKDGEVYARVLHSIAPDACPMGVVTMTEGPEKCKAVIESAKAIGVPSFIQPADIISGNRHLNLAFVAQIFNTRHGLEDVDAAKVAEIYDAAGLSDDKEEDAREERVFRMWMNSLNLDSGQLHHLFDDLNDGLFLIEAIEKVAPGTLTPADKVNRDRSKLNRFKKIENCNIAVTLGKRLGFSLPGTGGIDIAAGNPKLVLGFVWQLMRLQVVTLLKEVGGGVVPKDSDIIDWANATVEASGKPGKITSFKDAELATGVFLLNLLGAVEPRAINPEIPTPGATDDERAKNAKYIISVARKIGAQVFLTWEDITDVKQKMIMTLVASIMHTARARGETGGGGAAGGAGGKA